LRFCETGSVDRNLLTMEMSWCSLKLYPTKSWRISLRTKF
jgi:hypothetical protein